MANPEQHGAVIVFRPDVSKEQAEKALEKLASLLDHTPRVNSFNPDWGYPVFYVP